MSDNRPYYQLTTKNTMPTFYILFDNMDIDERLVVIVMIYHLDTREYEETAKKIRSMFGKNALEDNEELEFMKYVIFLYKDEDPKVIDMDTLRFVTPKGKLSLLNGLKRRDMVQGDPIELGKQHTTIQNGPSLHLNEVSNSTGYMRYKTKKHGRICFKFSRYKNPNVRNGVSIDVQRNISKRSMYGSLIYATDPKYVLVKKIRVPPVPSEKTIDDMIATKYWTKQETKISYMGKKSSDTVLLPKGKYKKEAHEKYTKL